MEINLNNKPGLEGGGYITNIKYGKYIGFLHTAEEGLHEERKMRRLFSPAGRKVRTVRAMWRN